MGIGRKMKIVLATCGSRGDVQPMVALSLALIKEGHDVLLAGPPEKAHWAETLGCPYQGLGTDVTAFIDSMKNAHSVSSAIFFLKFLRNEVRSQFAVLPKIIAGADLTVGASLVYALPGVAKAMGIDYRYIAFTPQLLPSSHHPYPIFKHQGLPGWCNRLTWWVGRHSDRFLLRRIINRQHKKMGLEPIQDTVYHVLGMRVIVASDPALGGVPADVRVPFFSQTGYLHLSQPEQYSSELCAFLDRGPPPVYAGFGSMPKGDQMRILPVIVEAVRQNGRGAVISKFWDEPSEFEKDEDILFIRNYPHSHLFPLMSAIIHHGGAGTTATSAISGVPQVVVPHILDQYYWGHRIYLSRLGPKPVWRSDLTVQKLTEAIQECLCNEQIRQTAKRTGEIIKQQDGLALAVGELLS